MTSFLVSIDEGYDENARDQIGRDIVEFIKQRTLSGLDKNNKPFRPYSKNYINSAEFRIAKKDPKDVNLKLTGDMVYSLDVISHGPGYITIGFDDGSEAGDKAEWNAEKGRDMLGIMPSDLADILSNYPIPAPEYQLAEDAADEILKRLFGEQ